MPKNRDKRVIGLDLGTTKTCVIVGQVNGEGVDILGIGSTPSRGLKKGSLIDLQATVNSIKIALEEAENVSGGNIETVFTGITGDHVIGINREGKIPIGLKEITGEDIKKAIDMAKDLDIPQDREIIHIIPQEYIIDNQRGIREPLGIIGERLTAKTHIVTVALASAQNLIKAANLSGLDVKDIILQPLASAEAVLSPDEKELGVALVDIGGGTTDISIFSGGTIQYTKVLALGGNHITTDLAYGLQTPLEEAEEIKKRFGSVSSSILVSEEPIEISRLGRKEKRSVSQKLIGEIIRFRVEEILEKIKEEILLSGYKDLLSAGMVLTGGSSLLSGICELGEEILDLSVRIGYPTQRINGSSDFVKNPIYATAVGLVLYGARDMMNKEILSPNSFAQSKGGGIFKKIGSAIKQWIFDIL